MKLVFTVPRPPDFVFAALTDPQRFVAAHPVIYRLDPLGGDHYRVFERLAFGPLAARFTYPATLSGDPQRRTVTMSAVVKRLVTIRMSFRLEAQPGAAGTVVHETVQFQSWLPVQAMLRPLFARLHGQLFRAIGQAPP